MAEQIQSRARAQQHQIHFGYQSFYIDKNQPLGHGAYGAVYKAKCDQLPCAAKVLHPTILDPRDPGARMIVERFRQECAFLESIRHTNIVQYLGMVTDPDSGLPVLLMELLDESLTTLLERSQESLPYHVEVDICHDVALAVAYLHSNDIIHRDLSSNNVLINAGKRAKVTDFGMSKLAGADPKMTSLTMCPGTLAYMPPESLRDPTVYTKKLDCFSEGVLMIQVCTRQWPQPGPRTQIIQDSRSPIGVIEMPVPEAERRRNHIDLVNSSHPLLPIARDCLEYQENERPSSEELCERLAHLKESGSYQGSILEEKEKTHTYDDQISQQVEDGNKKQVKKQLLLPHSTHGPLAWTDGGRAPFRMERGAAVVDGKVAYFMSWNGMTSFYNSIIKRWGTLPQCPHWFSSLAVISGQLTAVGGCTDIVDKTTYTDKLLSLRTDPLEGWVDVFPSMPTKRCSTTAVAVNDHLIVAGGRHGPYCTDAIAIVEVMDCTSRVWSTKESLPRPSCLASAAIFAEDRLYMLGGWDDKDKVKSVLTCSLSKLFQSVPSPSGIWRRVANAPAYLTTCVVVDGRLLAVGGCDKDNRATAAVHVYNPSTDSWHVISHMVAAKWYCLAAVLPTNEMIVVGGRINVSKFVDDIEIASFSFI